MSNNSLIDVLKSNQSWEVEYVDGSKESITPTEMAINSTIWQTADYYKLPIKREYSVTRYYTNGFFSDSSITDAYGRVLLDILMTQNPVNLPHVFGKLVQDGIQWIHNHIAVMSKEYETSALVKEILDIQLNPLIMKKINEVSRSPSPKKVKDVYDTLKQVIFSDEMKDNMVAWSYMSETVSPKQANQCLGLRGYPSNLDSKIYTTPITSSYALGLKNTAFMAMESRGAATALFYSTTAIQDSESFAKKLQIVTEVVDKLVYSDCGSTEGINWHVRSPGYNELNEWYKGDLEGLIGQYFKFKEEDPWELITPESEHIVGKDIILRTALSCKLKDRQSVCIHCFGKQGYNMVPTFNVGHWSATQLNEPASQSLLSTKHYIVSADSGVYVLSDSDKKVFKVADEKILIDFDLKKFKEVNLIVSDSNLYGLKSITSLSSARAADPSRNSKVEEVTIETVSNNGDINRFVVRTRKSSKYTVFTSKFLQYIVNKGYRYEKGKYIINIKSFNPKVPIMYIPNMVFDFQKYNLELRAIITDNKSPRKDLLKTTDALLTTLFSTVHSKLYTHISALALITYALSVRSAKNRDYRLSRGIDSEVSKLTTLIRYRTLPTLWANGTIKNIYDPKLLVPRGREYHPLSVLFKPKEITEYESNRKEHVV